MFNRVLNKPLKLALNNVCLERERDSTELVFFVHNKDVGINFFSRLGNVVLFLHNRHGTQNEVFH